MRQKYPLAKLLKLVGLKRSVFYYQRLALAAPDKYAEVKSHIQVIFHEHRGRYGYRRVTAALAKLGKHVNHNTVQRLMGEMGLKSLVRIKKYRSYRGEMGLAAPNVLQRNFEAENVNEKWVTDVTEVLVAGEKVYISPVMDLCNGQIITYETSKHPKFELVLNMLKKALAGLKDGESPTLHSDQGWHYRMPLYQSILQERGLTQSMSRKGNCHDNAPMESFFAVMKSEYFHLNKFESVKDFLDGLAEYIRYYNNDRIKQKLNWLSPVGYRTQLAAT